MQHFTFKMPAFFAHSVNILRGSFLGLFVFVAAFCAFAQQPMPVTGSLQVNTPYPAKWSEYAATGANLMGLNLTLNEAELGAMNVRLKLYIERNNTLIATSSDVVTGVPTLNLVPYITRQLGSLDLNPYFRFENLQGFSTPQYQQPLEDGVYRLSFEVVNATTGQRLSAPIGQSIFITLNDAPQLTQPSKGEQIVASSGSNLTFQWLSRATTALPLQYEWTVIEVPVGTTNVEALWATAPVLYRATSATNTLPRPVSNFTTGKTYAWRVQAKATSGISLFKNNGFSETFSFQMGSTCPAVTGLALTPKASDVIAVSWTGATTYYNYRVAYRKYSTTTVWEWVEQATTNTFLNLTGLEAATEYEVKVGGVCANGATSFSAPLRATTLALGQIQGLNCGQMPPLPAAGTPIASLAIGDVIMSGDFPVTLTKVAGGNGNFTGEGWVKIPWMGSTKIKVTFANIGVNTEKKLTSGFLQTAYDPNWGNILNVDGIFEGGTNVGIIRSGRDTAEFYTNFPISTVNWNSSTGTITITGSGGQSQTFTGVTLPTTIKDNLGQIYGVNANGTVIAIGRTVPMTMTSTELNTLSSDKGSVVFTQPTVLQKPLYAFDAYQEAYDKDVLWRTKYEKIGAYGVGRKAGAPGKPDIINASVLLTDATFKADSVRFITAKGMQYTSKSLGSGAYEVNVVGGPGGDGQELYALYPKADGKFFSLGKIMIASYKPQTKRVKLIPVNGAIINESAISQKLNEAYNPVAVKWEVTKDENFANMTWDINGDRYLAVDGSGFLSTQTSEMLALNRAYKSAREVESDMIYLFVLNQASDATVAGDMPRGKQFGYLFTNTNFNLGQVAAHEVGHGVFKLKHTFDNSYNFKREDLTDNLMNYNNGVQLSKYQWDVVHDPGIALGLFDSDDDAQASEVGIKTTAIADFVTPNGYLIRLPAQTEILYGCDYDDGELPAGTLRRFKTANGKVYNIVTQGNKLSNPDTWRFLGYKCNGVSYPNTEGVASSSVVRVDQTMLESSAANSATKGQLKLSFSTLSSAIPRYTEGVAQTIKFNIFEGSTNGAAIGQPLIVVKPCAAAIASTLPPSFGMTGVQFRDFVESLKGMGKGFDDGGICVKIVTIDYEKGAIPKIIHEPRNCGGSTNLITLTLRYKDPADGNPSVGNGVVMVWDLAGAYSPPCVREYVLEGVRKLEQNIVYIGKVDAEKLLIKGGYIIYRTVIGLVSCSTNPTAAADLKARGGTDAELFTMGMTYELITLVDVLGMAEGIVDIAGMATKAVVQSYVDYARYSSATIAKIATRQPVTEEEVVYLFISPDKQLFLQGITTAKKIGEELKKEYLGDAYKHGRLTVLVVPIVFTGGTYIVARGPQMFTKMGALLGKTVGEINNFASKIALAIRKNWTITKDITKVTFSKDGKVFKFFKRGERWEPEIPRSQVTDPEYAEFIDTDLNTPGSGATPVIVEQGSLPTLFRSLAKIRLNSEYLSEMCMNFRKTRNLWHDGNLVVFEYLDNNGVIKHHIQTTLENSGKHAERLAIEFLESNNIPLGNVKKIYSELELCELNSGGTGVGGCRKMVQEKIGVNIDVKFSYDYPGHDNATKGIRQASIDQRRIDFNNYKN